MRMIKTNLEKLVDLAVSGTAGHPATGDSGEKAAYDGGSASPLGFSGINFTVKVGDSAFDWAGTHEVSPGVAVKNCCDSSNEALLALSCIGNEAILIDAKMEGKDAKLKGTPGVVTGKLSAGRVLVYFPKRVVERITVGDQSQVRVPVAKVIPGKLLGAGVGRTNTRTHEYDIQSTSPEAVKEFSLDQLRLGDLVAIAD